MVYVYADASWSRENHVPTCGVGVVIYGKDKVGEWGNTYQNVQSSQTAEAQAVIFALELAVEHDFRRVSLYNDFVTKEYLESNGFSNRFAALATNFGSHKLELIHLDGSSSRMHRKRYKIANDIARIYRQKPVARKIA